MPDVLVDTNVLVYAVDPANPKKQKCAIEILDSLAKEGNGVLSSQCLSEYFSVITRKISPPVPPEKAYDSIVALCGIWPIEPLTSGVVREAVQASMRYGMNFWDAQIWAAAKAHGATTILTEDFADGRSVEGVRFRNPFIGV